MGRGGEEGEEEERGEKGEEEEEGEEGVIGRLRCEVSTFPASETAKPPLVVPPAPPGLPESRGWGRWSFLQRRLAPWSPVLPEPHSPRLPSSLGQSPLPSGLAPHP